MQFKLVFKLVILLSLTVSGWAATTCGTLSLSTTYYTNTGSTGFGRTVSIQGDYFVMCARDQDHNGYTDWGICHGYRKVSGTWTFVNSFGHSIAFNNPAWDTHGYSAAMWGGGVLAGAIGYDGSYTDQGVAAYYSYTSNSNAYIQYSTFIPSDYSASAQFGHRIVRYDTWAAIVARGTRKVYMFQKISSSPYWTQQFTFTSPGSTTQEFGYAIDIQSSLMVVGDYSYDGGVASNAGQVYVYTRSSSTWSYRKAIDPPTYDGGGYFGVSVGADGSSRFAVGASREDIDGNSKVGAVYIFSGSGTSWSMDDRVVAPDGAANDEFGYSLAIDDDVLAVGARYHNSNDGAVYFYVRASDGTWEYKKKVSGSTDGLLGTVLSMDNGVVLAGAPGADSSNGRVYRTTVTCSPTAAPTTSPSSSPTSLSPTLSPTFSPTTSPTTSPTLSPTLSPTVSPSVSPTISPTHSPTTSPTVSPTLSPTVSPTVSPSVSPTVSPTLSPTASPTAPTASPSTLSPTASPTTLQPTASPVDNTRPIPTGGRIALDDTSPTLVVVCNEDIDDSSAVIVEGLSVTHDGESVQLGVGNSAAQVVGAEITVQLTEDQRKDINLMLLSAGEAQLVVAQNSFQDLRGNKVADGNPAVDLEETRDSTIPVLMSATLVLDQPSILTTTWSEHVASSAGTILTDQLAITGVHPSGAGRHTLPLSSDIATLNSALPTKELSFTLSETLRSEILQLSPSYQFGTTQNGAISDLTGNSADALYVDITTTPDATKPEIVSVSLDHEIPSVLTITTSEIVHNVDLSKLWLSDTNGGAEIPLIGATSFSASTSETRIVVVLSEPQRIKAVSYSNLSGGNGVSVKLQVAAGAFQDFASNNVATATDVGVTETAELTIPTIISAELDLSQPSKLTIQCSETIDTTPVSAVDLSKIFLSDTNAGTEVPLDDSENPATVIVPSEPSSIIEIKLTEFQRARAISYSYKSDESAVKLQVYQGAFQDMSHNLVAHSEDVGVVEINDAVPPTITGASLNFQQPGTLIITANEVIRTKQVESVLLSRLALSDTVGGSEIPLIGAVVSSPGSENTNQLTIILSEQKRNMAIGYSHISGNGNVLMLQVEQGAILDATGNEIGDLVDYPVTEVAADTLAPTVASATLVFNNPATLQITCSEYISLSSSDDIDISKMWLSDKDSSQPDPGTMISLTASTWSISSASDILILTLSNDARRDAILSSGTSGGDGTALFLQVTAGAFKDISNNENNAQSDIVVVEIGDGTPPVVESVSIDFNLPCKLTIQCDEFIVTNDAGKVDLGRLALSNSLGGDEIPLSSATLVSQEDSNLVILTLSDEQRGFAIRYSNGPGGNQSPLYLQITGGAFQDVALRTVLPRPDIQVTEVADSLKPTIVSATLDLNPPANLQVVCDEWIDDDVSGLYLSKLFLSDLAGGRDIALEGNEFQLATPTPQSFIVQLTEAQRVQATKYSNGLGGNGGVVLLQTLAGAFRDLSQNTVAIDVDRQVTEIADVTRPTMVSVTLMLDRPARLEIVTSETIDASPRTNVDLNGIVLSNTPSGHELPLSTFDTIRESESSNTIVIDLSEETRVAAIRYSNTAGGDGLAMWLQLANGAFFDLARNGIQQYEDYPITERGDETKPTVTSCSIDLSQPSVVTLVTDETVNALPRSEVVLDSFSMYIPNTQTVQSFHGALVGEANDQSSLRFEIPEHLRYWVVSNTGVRLTMLGSGFVDIAGNGANAVQDMEVTVSQLDDTPPTLTNLALDLNSPAQLTLTFSEMCDPSRFVYDNFQFSVPQLPLLRELLGDTIATALPNIPAQQFVFGIHEASRSKLSHMESLGTLKLSVLLGAAIDAAGNDMRVSSASFNSLQTDTVPPELEGVELNAKAVPGREYLVIKSSEGLANVMDSSKMFLSTSDPPGSDKLSLVGSVLNTSPYDATYLNISLAQGASNMVKENLFEQVNGELFLTVESSAVEDYAGNTLTTSKTFPVTLVTASPTQSPTMSPTKAPSKYPTSAPTTSPTESPITATPTREPTMSPTVSPTKSPSMSPTHFPTMSPTQAPTEQVRVVSISIDLETTSAATRRRMLLTLKQRMGYDPIRWRELASAPISVLDAKRSFVSAMNAMDGLNDPIEIDDVELVSVDEIRTGVFRMVFEVEAETTVFAEEVKSFVQSPKFGDIYVAEAKSKPGGESLLRINDIKIDIAVKAEWTRSPTTLNPTSNIGVIVACVCAAGLLIIVAIWYKWRKRQTRTAVNPDVSSAKNVMSQHPMSQHPMSQHSMSQHSMSQQEQSQQQRQSSNADELENHIGLVADDDVERIRSNRFVAGGESTYDLFLSHKQSDAKQLVTKIILTLERCKLLDVTWLVVNNSDKLYERRQLVQKLHPSNEVTFWTDQTEDDTRIDIENMLHHSQHSRMFVFILTANVFQSYWAMFELVCALRAKQKIVVLRVNNQKDQIEYAELEGARVKDNCAPSAEKCTNHLPGFEDIVHFIYTMPGIMIEYTDLADSGLSVCSKPEVVKKLATELFNELYEGFKGGVLDQRRRDQGAKLVTNIPKSLRDFLDKENTTIKAENIPHWIGLNRTASWHRAKTTIAPQMKHTRSLHVSGKNRPLPTLVEPFEPYAEMPVVMAKAIAQ